MAQSLSTGRLNGALPTFESFEDWTDYGAKLDKARDAYQWRRGDWWNAGSPYGDRVESVGEQHSTYRNYGVVANTFDVSRRRDTLPFYAHAEVCVLPEDEQESVLDWVEKTGAARADIREEVRFRKAMPVTETPQLPPGKYSLIYADPPWRYDFSKSDSRQIENQYPTMDLDEICGLPVNDLAHDDCVLIMWATSPKLRESLVALDAWGFEYKTCAVWDKEIIGMGYYFRQQHELMLIATRGNIPAPNPANRPRSIFVERRSKHSSKPEIAYQIIETMYPALPKVELFARNRREGWAVWGNQA